MVPAVRPENPGDQAGSDVQDVRMAPGSPQAGSALAAPKGRRSIRPEDYAVQVLTLLRFIVKHPGKSNAVKAGQIQNALGLDPRTTADIAGFLVKHGYSVCSCADGYFYAASEQEWTEHLNKERDRAIALLMKVKEARKNHVHQITLFEQKPAA